MGNSRGWTRGLKVLLQKTTNYICKIKSVVTCREISKIRSSIGITVRNIEILNQLIIFVLHVTNIQRETDRLERKTVPENVHSKLAIFKESRHFRGNGTEINSNSNY